MARPGVMLYFDIRQPLEMLSNEDKGRLLDAILEYGEFGTAPEFDGMLKMAWGFIKPKLDRDYEKYEVKSLKNQYSAYKRWAIDKGKRVLEYEEWLQKRGDGDANACNPMQTHASYANYNSTTPTPTTTPTTTPATTPTTTPATTPAATAGALSADFLNSTAGIDAPENKKQKEIPFDDLKHQAINKLKNYQM